MLGGRIMEAKCLVLVGSLMARFHRLMVPEGPHCSVSELLKDRLKVLMHFQTDGWDRVVLNGVCVCVCVCVIVCVCVCPQTQPDHNEPTGRASERLRERPVYTRKGSRQCENCV